MSADVAMPAAQQQAGVAPQQQQQAQQRLLMKRKRSSDAASECTTHTTECDTDTSAQALHGAAPPDPTAQQLADRRDQHATERLQLEERLQQLQEQRQHVAQQLEQLEGCDRDAAGDLRAQLQAYEQQHAAASAKLAALGRTFEAEVAAILSTAPGAAPQALAAAVQQQQQLQDAKVAQLAVEQQLGGFAVTAPSSKHKDKRARLDSVWTWLQDSSSAAAEGQAAQQLAQPAAAGQQQQPQASPGREEPAAGAAVAAGCAVPAPQQRSPAAPAASNGQQPVFLTSCSSGSEQ